MRTVLGKHVYEALPEVLLPDHTAIIVVDMQNDLVSIDRPAAKRGAPPPASRQAIGPLQLLLESGRQAKVPIVYIVYTMDTSYASTSPAWIDYSGRISPRTGRTKSGNLEVGLEGTWGQQVIPELAPQAGDFIVRKHRLGGFWGTELDQVLRSNNIETTLITGTATAGCVLDTAIGASAYDYYTVIASDCVAGSMDLQQSGMTLLEDRYDCILSEEIIKLWAGTL
jgi:ureidoacrylate peracid hydrolase